MKGKDNKSALREGRLPVWTVPVTSNPLTSEGGEEDEVGVAEGDAE